MIVKEFPWLLANHRHNTTANNGITSSKTVLSYQPPSDQSLAVIETK